MQYWLHAEQCVPLKRRWLMKNVEKLLAEQLGLLRYSLDQIIPLSTVGIHNEKWKAIERKSLQTKEKL